MATVYLVKRNATAPMSCYNWKLMNERDFERFKMTREGQQRLSSFAELDPYGECKPQIMAECGTVRAHQWHREKERYDCMEKMRRQREAQTMQVRRRTRTMKRDLEKGLEPADPKTDVERYVIWKEQREILIRGLEQLTEEQRDVLDGLYVRNPGISEEILAQELGVTRAVVHNRKCQALSRMREYLIRNGTTAPCRVMIEAQK